MRAGIIDHADGVAGAAPVQTGDDMAWSVPLVALGSPEPGDRADRSLTGAPGWPPWRFTLWSVGTSRRPPRGGSHAGRPAASDAWPSRRALGWADTTPLRGSASAHPKVHQ